MYVCVRVRLRVFMTQWILEPVCGRGLPAQEASEPGAPSVTPPVNSDFHHPGHPLLRSLYSHQCLQSVFLYACFCVSPPLLLMGSCVGKEKTEGRLRRCKWPGVDARLWAGLFPLSHCHLGGFYFNSWPMALNCSLFGVINVHSNISHVGEVYFA